MHHLTSIADLSESDATTLVAKAFEFKQKYELGLRRENRLDGKVVALVFEKPSLRTKVSFEVAITYLAGSAVFLSSEQIVASGNNVKGRESIPDIGKNLERFADLVIARVYSHSTITSLANAVKIPVINALCDVHHPTQALADYMTLCWHFPDLKNIKVAYVGDGANVATSLVQMCGLMGVSIVAASPKGYEIPENEKAFARKLAMQSGSSIDFIHSPEEAVQGADVIYTDAIFSMGQETEREHRMKIFPPYQVNEALFKKAKADAKFMHCLPAHRGEEVTDEVMDSSRSIVFDQAECRLHVAKALIAQLLG